MSFNLASNGYPGTISILHHFNFHVVVIHKVGSRRPAQFLFFFKNLLHHCSHNQVDFTFSKMYRHEQSGRRWWWCHARHQKKGSHFINDQKGWWVSVALPFNNLFFSSSTFSCMETPHSLPPPQLLVVSHVAVMLLLLLFITERLMLIFALPWLSVLCWLLFTSFSFHAPRPLLPLSLPSSSPSDL